MNVTEEQLRLLIKSALLSEAQMSKRKLSTTQLSSRSTSSSTVEDDEASEFFPMSSKNIDDVDNSSFSNNFRATVTQIMNALTEEGFQPILGSAYRSPKEQKEKISQGYSKSKTIYGYHVALNEKGEKAALAVDLVDKRYNWGEGSEDIKLGAEKFFKALGEICDSANFKSKVTWGGSWKPKTFKVKGEEFTRGWDPAHVQTDAVTMQQSAERTKKGLAVLETKGEGAPDSSTASPNDQTTEKAEDKS